MKVWLIDDEQPCLDELAWQLKQYPDLELAGMDTDPEKCLGRITENPPDAVFLDIDMPTLDGLELALLIQERCKGTVVIFVTAHAQFALEAFKVHPIDFLLKPVMKKRLEDCVNYLREHYALLHPKTSPKRTLSIRCFGSFEITCEKEIKWATRRVRELFLYLIDRNGASASKAELLDTLFCGQNDKNTIHNLYMTIYRLKCLLDTLDPVREQIRLTEDNALIIVPGVCDFTDFMRFARENAVITGQNSKQAAQTLSLYRGVYLQNERFDWIVENANETQAEYERIALGLSNFQITSHHPHEAEHILTGLLRRNALCEEAHTLLLDLALQSGNRGTYLVRYEQYTRILHNELHLKPSAYYRKQYERLKP